MRCVRINWKVKSCFTCVVLNLQSVDEMLKCDSSSDVIENKCSRWDETVPEILCTASFGTDSKSSFSPYYMTGCEEGGGGKEQHKKTNGKKKS